jgi:hypothetical protein
MRIPYGNEIELFGLSPPLVQKVLGFFFNPSLALPAKIEVSYQLDTMIMSAKDEGLVSCESHS